jgi:hypothetical protein
MCRSIVDTTDEVHGAGAGPIRRRGGRPGRPELPGGGPGPRGVEVLGGQAGRPLPDGGLRGDQAPLAGAPAHSAQDLPRARGPDRGAPQAADRGRAQRRRRHHPPPPQPPRRPHPSIATIWRVLRRRGFVTPQPHKRPRSSWRRFEASMPNECWQSDLTHLRLACGTEVEIVNFLDDYSRVLIASRVFAVTTARAVVGVFRAAAKIWGFPAAILTDNGCVYTARHRGGATALRSSCSRLASSSATPARAIPRPAARSSASTRHSSGSSPASRLPRRSPSSKPRSIASWPTTTR